LVFVEENRMLKKIIIAACLFSFLFVPINGFCVKAEEKGLEHHKAHNEIKTMAKPIVPNIPEGYDDLTDTFEKYWGALKTYDFEDAYKLESNDYRERESLDLYLHKHKKAIEIISITALEVKEISEKEVIVKAALGFKAGPIDTVRFIMDGWIKESDGWKHLRKGLQ
jgi:hypothetical protein